MKEIRRRFITLIEIMVVITLIALIAGALAYNYFGSLEAGRVFKTQANIERIETILNLKVAEDPRVLENISNTWPVFVRESPLVKNPEDVLKDGWGQDYTVSVDNGAIRVTSTAYNNYRNAKAGGS